MGRINKMAFSLGAITTISISIAFNTDAQQVESFRASTNITPQVESFQITKCGNLTPSLYTGAMTYSLPLYTYSDPDFCLPITLEYNYDGYKVARSAGTIGLGWALNSGGIITREIRGLKDEYTKDNFDGNGHSLYGYYWAYKNNVALSSQFTINRPRTPDITITTSADLVRYLSDDLYEDYPISTYGDSYDLSPDLFHFSFGPYSGDFIMNNNGTLTLTSSTHPQGEFDITIETIQGFEGASLVFKIKTGNGYEYTFGDAESAREYHISSVIKDECPDNNNITGTMSSWTDTAWKLTKIMAPNGRIVLFSYTKKPNLTPTVTYSYSTYTELLPTSESMPAPRDSLPSWERVNLNYGYSHPVEQIRIFNAEKTRTESTISFSWKDKTSPEDEMSAVNYENMIVSSYLDSHPLAIRNVKLSEINVRNIDNEITEHIRINQSRIGSNNGAGRMVLSSVSISKYGVWSFDYDKSLGTVPTFDSKRHDLWGFWCPVNFDPREDYMRDNLESSTWRFLERLDYLKCGALTKIRYPTYGWSEIAYEKHDTEFVLNRFTDAPPTLKPSKKECGGIRVSQIMDKQIESDSTFVKSYRYNQGELLSLRWTSIKTEYLKNWGMANQTGIGAIFYSNGYQTGEVYSDVIGYRQVTEYFQDGSYIIHRFNGYKEYGDYYKVDPSEWIDSNTENSPTDVASKTGGLDLITKLISPLWTYKDFRGKVKSKEEYNNVGKLVKKTTYEYTPLEGMSENRFFNMMVGWMNFHQTRFYPKLSSIKTTRYEPSFGDSSSLTTFVNYEYDRHTGQKVLERAGSYYKIFNTQYIYCSSSPNAGDACPQKAAISDIITSITEGGSTLYTGKIHFSYLKGSKGIAPVSLTEYILDTPCQTSPSNSNSRLETTNISYNTMLHPYKVTMPGGAYIKYGWDNAGKHIISRTANSLENETKYSWKDLIGLTSIKDPSGLITWYGYNQKGRLTEIRDSDSTRVVSYDIYLMTEGGDAFNRIRTFKHLTEDGTEYTCDLEFYNSLGYLDQTILDAGSGDGNDIITPYKWDQIHKTDIQSYLPYPGIGNWRRNWKVLSDQQKWYSDNFNDDRPYTERTYESGVSGRLLTEQKPGVIYQKSQKKTQYNYSLNSMNDNIFRFQHHYAANNSSYPSIVCTGVRPEGNISRVTIINEDQDTTQIFTDERGQLVLERKINDGVNHDTYYIYNLKDSLVCVIQPVGSSKMHIGKEITFNGSFASDYCFTWRYDGKGRIIESHVPGAGIKRYAYDLRGRLVYMDDSNLSNAEGHAMYYTYDELDRPIIEGVCIPRHSINYIRGALSEGYLITNLLADSFPTKTTRYYSQKSTEIPPDLSFNEVANVVSFEDVDSTHCITFPSYELVMEAPYYATTTHPNGKSGITLVTPHIFIKRAHWYDKKGRIIQTVEKSSDGWTSRYSTKYDFVGNVIATMEAHTSQFGNTDSLLTVNTYDKRGRLKTYTRTMNGHEFSPVYYSYDFSGRIKEKHVGGVSTNGTANLLETYSRDIRGLMTDISINSHAIGQVFSESLEYMSPTLPASRLFSGNISTITINSYNQKTIKNTYNYDHLGRLLGNYRYVDGVPTTIGTESGITYDLNGNINRLTRHDGNSKYTICMEHIGNRISGGEYDFDIPDRTKITLSFSYDYNGNIINMCQSDSIQYNILNLPRRSAGTTISYYSDGKKVSTIHSTGRGWKYRGNFIYNDNGGGIGTLESVAYQDGRILSSPEIPISGDADCWHVKDHLGNIRVLYCLNSGGYMPVFEINDYLPFGGRIQNSSQPSFPLNHYRYAGKEEINNFVVCNNLSNLTLTANDFGARFLTSFFGSWTSPDPITQSNYSTSSYSFCANNPINLIDPNGMRPIYSTKGILLGTDESGLQGEPIIMNEENFIQGMSSDSAEKYNKGKSGFEDFDALEKFEDSYSHLSERPDWDGALTKKEADEWWLSKSGKPLYVNQSLIDLPGISTQSFGNQNGAQIYKNFIWSLSKTGMVYGTLKLTLINNRTGAVYIGGSNSYLDEYDFKMDGRLFRDIATWIGRPGKANSGKSYKIYSYGYGLVEVK